MPGYIVQAGENHAEYWHTWAYHGRILPNEKGIPYAHRDCARPLEAGVTEAELVAASDRFQSEFVVEHPGVLRRLLVAELDGGYADIVLFADEQAIDEVMEAEQDSAVCHDFMALWDDVGMHTYRVVKTYE